MRKYSALFAMIITLWAAFAPIGFSVLQVREQNQEMDKNVVVVKMNVNKVSAQSSFGTGAPSTGLGTTGTGSAGLGTGATSTGLNTGNTPDDGLKNDTNVNGSKTDLSCGRFDFACKLTVFVVDLITFVPNFIAVLAGILADIFLKLSISPSSYGATEGQGIESGIRIAWKIVRDFANIGFIFSLFVAAFMMILNKTSIGGTQFDPKRTVVRVIIMALLVNFSLLFCRLVIQTADVFSNVLYNKIGNNKEYGGTTVKIAAGVLGDRFVSISLPIIDNADPQQLFLNGKVDLKSDGSNAAYLIVGIIAFFVLFVLIWVFTSMILIFLGRILGLWLGMILSPLAFVSWSIPFLENNEFIGFNNWLKNFTQLAFMTPVYLFFVYITASILKISDFSTITSSTDTGWMAATLNIAISTMIPLFLSVFLLMKGKKIATDMSGEVGKMVAGWSGAVTGLALGAATGGAGFMARQTLGRGASALATSTASSTGMVGKGINRMSKAVGASTFDVRNNKFAMDKFGKVTGAAGEKIDLGTRNLQKEGGYLASGGINQILADRKERIADEQASAAEAAAKAAAENPQSRENIAKRNAERKLAANKKAKEAEEARIAMAAENTPIDNTKDQKDTNDAITANNARMTAIDTELAGKKEMTAQELADNQSQKQAAEQAMAAANTKSADLEAKLAANAKKVGTTATQSQDIIDEKAALEKEKADNEKQKTTLQAELVSTTAKEKEHSDVTALRKEKTELSEKNAGFTQKLVSLQNVNGKTPAQLKHDAAVKKLEAQDTAEGKALAAADKEIADKNKEIDELNKKAADLRKEGKTVEADEAKAKVAKLKKEVSESKSTGTHKLAKDAFDAKNGDIKEMEDAAKNATKTAISNGSARLDTITAEANKLQVDLLNANYAAQTKRKEILSAHANALDSLGTGLANPAFGVSEEASRSISNTLAVITGGVVGTVRGAGQNASTNVRNSARTGR